MEATALDLEETQEKHNLFVSKVHWIRKWQHFFLQVAPFLELKSLTK